MKLLNKKIRIYQQGFSLIELLVAMLIGIFLLAGISNSYMHSKTADRKTNQSSVLEDNGRFSLEILTDILEKTAFTPNAGILDRQFITDPAHVEQEQCPVTNDDSVVNTGIFNANTITAEGGGVESDSIGIIFHGDVGHYTDCAGGTLPDNCRMKELPDMTENPAAARIYNSFFVDTGTNTLRCAGSRTNAPVVIAEGVENIQFLYGIDEGANQKRYVQADEVAAWDQVVSIQVAVLVRSLKPVKDKPVSKQYKLLNTIITSDTDKYQREVFSTTVKLRNSL